MNKITVFSCCLLCALHIGISCHADNLETYTRVSGIVRYYSPNPYTENWENSDWLCIDYCNFSAICNGQSLEKVLEIYLSVFAPNSSITHEPSSGIRKIQTDKSDYCYWLHHGCGEIKIPGAARILNREYRNYRPFYKEMMPCSENEMEKRHETPQPDSIYSYQIADNLYLNMPIAECKDAFSKSKTASMLKDCKKQMDASIKQSGNSARDRILTLAGDKAFRFADIAFRWNIVQHFYPYHLEDSLEWESYLPKMIEAVDTLKNGKTTRSDIKTYYDAVLRAMNPVKDGHMLIHPSMTLGGMVSFYINYGHVPAIFRRNPVTGSIFFSDDRNAEILKINGNKPSLLFADCMRRVNMSNDAYASKLALIKMTQTANMGDPMLIESYNGTDVKTDTLYGTLKQPLYPEVIPDYNAEVIDNILVFNPTLTMNCYDRFLPYVDSIMAGKYKALVFDLRDYPAYDFDKVLAHLTDTSLSTSPLFHIPLSCFPNREHIRYAQSAEQIQPALPQIRIPVFFLSSYNTMSWGETVLMLVKGYGLGTVIGTPTAGTNGDATSVPMPLFDFRMTAIKATNIDGSRHHGLGVQPDIYADLETLADYIKIINNELHQKYQR